jgi:hypothetical protein
VAAARDPARAFMAADSEPARAPSNKKNMGHRAHHVPWAVEPAASRRRVHDGFLETFFLTLQSCRLRLFRTSPAQAMDAPPTIIARKERPAPISAA